jgi:ribosome-binding factor A
MLARLLMGGDLRDPDLAGVSITVSEVRISPDLYNATVFVTPLGGANGDAVVAALNRASAFLRGQVAREIQLRRAPAFSFTLDESFDQAAAIERALGAPSVARDVVADDDSTQGDPDADDSDAD